MTIEIAQKVTALVIRRNVLSEYLSEVMSISPDKLEFEKSVIVKWLATEIVETDKRIEKSN